MTTILSVRTKGKVVFIGDGQVSMGNTVMKSNARKLRTTYGGKVLAGFAGSTADAFTLFEKFDVKLEEYSGNLLRAAVELAKDWRTNKMLRNLEALLAVADSKMTLILSGTGDVIEPEHGVIGIGSGGQFAYAAALGLIQNTELSAKEIAQKSMDIATSICVFSNNNYAIEEIDSDN